ncbi:hypothetical protein [Moorena sp. SIO4G3]|uniref:hypothetical protein n=1 Tax=Moorena sp. SIO4G3 TaxID=2607821 RepID=UPI00142BAF81|nr:hypothetical protein [Moorena sp. SIO4G3]NEO75667.1 hypothetical protein [Moorena sp. SIO4G3]
MQEAPKRCSAFMRGFPPLAIASRQAKQSMAGFRVNAEAVPKINPAEFQQLSFRLA